MKRYRLTVCCFLWAAPMLIPRECAAKDSGSLCRYVATWGAKGSGVLEFLDPEALSAAPNGDLYVSDTGNHRIQRIHSDGEYAGSIGGFGWGNYQLNRPAGLTAANGLDVLVADQHNHRLVRYDKDLNFISTFSSSNSWPVHLQFEFPRDVFLSRSGELFCLDSENRRILKLDVLGNPRLSFGGFDAGQGRLMNPQGLTVWQDRVYVTDLDPPRIVVFDTHGNYYRTIRAGTLVRPRGLAGFADTWLLAADEASGVHIFDVFGNHIETFGQSIGAVLEEAVDVICWRDRIYVLDRRRCAIDIYQWSVPKERPIR
ncbi:MAG TPA: hypothetical protein ENN03_01255 [bacterium]|nr:hypothetical protein [bacterium]